MRPLLLLVLVAAAPPQEPSKAREELVNSLEEKVAEIPYIAFSFRVEDQRGDGKATEYGKGRIWYWADQFRLYGEITKQVKGGGTAEMNFLFNPNWILGYGTDGANVLVCPGLFRRVFRADFEESARLDAAFGVPPKHASFDAYLAAGKSFLTFEMAPDAKEKDQTSFNVRVGKGSGRNSWLKEMHEAPEAAVTLTPTEVTILAQPRRTVVIDRTTGFLKSIRLDMGEGLVKTLRIERLEPNPPLPDIRLPEKPEPHRLFPPGAETESRGSKMAAELPKLKDRIVSDWKQAGRPERAEALSDYLAGLAVRIVETVKETWRRKLVASAVDEWTSTGKSLDQISKAFEEAVSVLKEKMGRVEGPDVESRVRAEIDKIRVRMLELAREAPETVASTLTNRIDAAFQPERIKKALAACTPAGPDALLREELTERYALAAAWNSISAEAHSIQTQRMTDLLAAAGAYSCRVRLDVTGSKGSFQYVMDVRPAEGYVSVFRHVVDDVKRPPPDQSSVFFADGSMEVWTPGEKGVKYDRTRAADLTSRLRWDWELELAHLKVRPPGFATFEEFRKSFRPHVILDLVPPSKNEKKSDVKSGAQWRPEGGSRWIDDYRNATTFEYPDGPRGRTVRFGGAGWTTTVDLQTGLLHSMQNTLPNGKSVSLTVLDFTPGGPEPTLAKPAEFRKMEFPAEASSVELARYLSDALERESRALLHDWSWGDFAARPAAVRRFYSRGTAWIRSLFLDATRLKVASELVAKEVRAGKTIETLMSDSDALAGELERGWATLGPTLETLLEESDRKIETRLVEHIRKATASYEDRLSLARLVEEAIEPDLVKAALPERPAPDFKLLILAAIEMARRQKEAKD